jgi:glycosyltransferase involved in cell wall biosynthesis
MHPAINFLPRRAGRQRIVVTFHDLKVPYLFPKAGPLRDRAVTMLALHADAAIVTNRADELALNPRQVGRIARIPIGSNIALCLPDNYDRQAWRSQLKLTASDILLGFFGFFNQRKGVETLVRALAVLPRKHHLLFIGGTVGSSDATNQAYAEHISALVTQLGLENRVHYTGYVPASEVSAAFAASDLCVLPFADGISFHHGTLMAALAHKRPIVSTSPPVNLTELVHGENVWLVPPRDYAALAAAITTLASNPERRQHLAQGAAKLAAQFNWSHIAARTVELFESL